MPNRGLYPYQWEEQAGAIHRAVRGYFHYYAVPGNLDSLAVFRQRLLALWWRRLRRRSQQDRFSWTRTLALGQR